MSRAQIFERVCSLKFVSKFVSIVFKMSLSLEQFEVFMNMITEKLSTPPPLAVPKLEVLKDGHVSWADIPKLDVTKGDDLDTWFLSFESRMQAGRVPEDRWLGRFLECPAVEEETKANVRTLEVDDYASLRRRMLKQHGPIDPVSYFRQQIYEVKGICREDIRKQLVKTLHKHNRACDDTGREKLTYTDLVYPFAKAFSAASIRAQMMEKIPLAYENPVPLEHIFRLAPVSDVVHCALMQETSQEDSPSSQDSSNKRPLSEDQLCEAAAYFLQTSQQQGNGKRFKGGQRTQNSARRNPIPAGNNKACVGCGGSCKDRVNCPARTQKCHKCQKIGHYGRVCMKSAGTQKPPFQQPQTPS